MELIHAHTVYPLDLKLNLRLKQHVLLSNKALKLHLLKALTFRNPSPQEVNLYESFSVLVVDFFWAVVALQMWRLPIQPPVQRSRPPGEPQDPTLCQRNPWLKSCNLLVVMFLDHCISEVPT